MSVFSLQYNNLQYNTIQYDTIKCSSAQSTKTWLTVNYNVSKYMG